jgi:predicted kinase
LRLGLDVVLDFGVWARDERSALRWLSAQAGADCELVYMAVSELERRRRVEARFVAEPSSTYKEIHDDFETRAQKFQPPEQDELSSSPADPPPSGYHTWASWAAERWPSAIP